MRVELKPESKSKAVWIAVGGFFLPIIVGLLGRAFLQLRGVPVIELKWFFEPGGLRVTFILFNFLLADIPFIIAAVISHRLLRVEPAGSTTARVAAVCGMVTATALSSVVLFLLVWTSRYWEDFFLLGGLYLLPYMLTSLFLGLALGWLVGCVLQKRTAKANGSAAAIYR